METRYHFILRHLILIIDLVIINLCFFLSFYLLHQFNLNLHRGIYQYELLVSTLIWLACTYLFKLYLPKTVNELRRLNYATLITIVIYSELFVMFLLLSDGVYYSDKFLLVFNGLLISTFLLFRISMNGFINLLNKNLDLRKIVAVIGNDDAGLQLGNRLLNQRSLNFIGYLGGQSAEASIKGLASSMSIKNQVRLAVQSGVQEIYLPTEPANFNFYDDLVNEAEQNCIKLKFIPATINIDELILDANGISDYQTPALINEPLENIQNRLKKRLFDIFISLFVIIFIFSWLYPILALLIKIQSRGPVVFAQLRTGRDNKPFWCYKFRSMRLNEESELRQASVNDDRITPIGRFMRRTSLDEFPQFFNVLFGYMSISGPRPHMISHTDQYSKSIEKYMLRQFIKPGITGWAQVNGYRGETRELWLMKKRVEHDLWYRENWSMLLDVKIVFLTVFNIFKGEDNAY